MAQTHKGPLSGIVVVDLSRILAGPYCTLLMAEMGARVIKVEPPKGGDDARAYGPFVKGKSTYFASVNRGKESIALDLKNDEQRKIFEKLFVEPFRAKTGVNVTLDAGWWDAIGKLKLSPKGKPAYDLVLTDATQGYPAACWMRIRLPAGSRTAQSRTP